MKRQVLATVLLSILASSAFALPAAEQATPQVKADAAHFSQTVARSGSQEEENRDYAKGVAENGSEQANKRAYTEGLTEGGRDRLEEKGLVQDGYDKTPQGQTLASDGSDRTPHGQTLAEDGFDKTPLGQAVAEGGGDRVIERNIALS